jgi:hypothetical protein
MFLKKANFFENLTPLSLEPEAEPMKNQAWQAKPQFRAGFFTKFASPTMRVSPARFFASNPFQEMPVLPFKTPATTFLTDIETKFTNNTKKHKIWHRSKFRHSDFQHKNQNFD